MAGDTFKLTARPHPTWDLARISRLLYGHDVAAMKYLIRGAVREEWMGTNEELRELADIEELAVCEYREELFKILGRPPIGNYILGGTNQGEREYQLGRDRRSALIYICIALLVALAAAVWKYRAAMLESPPK
jgi:hypothetical protein